MTAQLEFASMIAEVEAQQNTVLDQHRQRVQAWFDDLAELEKNQLAEWMTLFQWDTCVALTAAAGDWCRTHANGK